MKLLFVAQNLEIGGIQTSLLNLLKTICNDKKVAEIDLFLFGEGELVKEVPKEISIYKGSLPLRIISTPFSRVINSLNVYYIILRVFFIALVSIIGSDRLYTWLFKRQMKFTGKYDVAISYFHDIPKGRFNRGTNLFVDKYVSAGRKIAWIHTDPVGAKFSREYCLILYNNFDRLVCVSNAVKEKVDIILPEYKDKSIVVYNMFPVNEIRVKAKEFVAYPNDPRVKLVTVARIDNNTKRIDRIIEICKQLKDNDITNFLWTIVGDGPDLKKNMNFSKNESVDKLISFVGWKDNPYPYIYSADFFILTSDFEGYPMVVGESLLLNTPVVTTNYAAVYEQIKDGYNGVVTKICSEDIFVKLKHLLSNKRLIDTYKDNIKNGSISNDLALTQFYHCIS